VTAPIRPDATRIARWLCSDRVVDDRARVLSWHNPDPPGYPYAEAAGLWLSWAAWRHETDQHGPDQALVEAVAARVLDEIEERGGAGRGDRLYLLDTCVVLDGLARVAVSHDVRPPDPAGTIQLVARFVARQTPVWPAEERTTRWSVVWGPHHLRSAGLLRRAASVLVDGELADLAGEIGALATGQSLPDPAYVHAHAYAVEGALLLGSYPGPAGDLDVPAEVAGLVALQDGDGSLPAWTDGTGGARGDATAQAARLWALLDPDRFAGPLDRALTHLAASQGDAGGVPYDDEHDDHNTWATVFADQATTWSRPGATRPRPEALI